MSNLARCIIFFAVLAVISVCCTRNHSIELSVVRHLPIYFHNNLLFGEDIKKMEETNAFIIATGRIDTTDEHPVIEAAFISIHNKNRQLNLAGKIQEGNTIITTYRDDEYTLSISRLMQPENNKTTIYEKAVAKISYNGKETVYEVYAGKGYM